MEGWRWALALIFLPYEALISFDAIAVTLTRLFIRRTQLLRWTTAAHTARLFGLERGAALAWREMILVPGFAVLLGLLVAAINPAALLVALPLLAVWFVSPQVAYRISRPDANAETLVALSTDQEVALHHLARQTWLFFEQLVGPGRSLAATRPLSGSAAQLDLAPHLADQHWNVPAIDVIRLRPGLHRHFGFSRATASDV